MMKRDVHKNLSVILHVLFVYFSFCNKTFARQAYTLTEVAHFTIKNYFNSSPLPVSQIAAQFQLPNQYKKSKGLFVTLSKDGQTRACWGAVDGQEKDLVRATVTATMGALNKEYRYKPIQKVK